MCGCIEPTNMNYVLEYDPWNHLCTTPGTRCKIKGTLLRCLECFEMYGPEGARGWGGKEYDDEEEEEEEEAANK